MLPAVCLNDKDEDEMTYNDYNAHDEKYVENYKLLLIDHKRQLFVLFRVGGCVRNDRRGRPAVVLLLIHQPLSLQVHGNLDVAHLVVVDQFQKGDDGDANGNCE